MYRRGEAATGPRMSGRWRRKGERVTDHEQMMESGAAVAPPADAAGNANGPAADTADAAAELAQTRAERDALLEQVQRARADYANLKRRSAQEAAQAQQRAAEHILRDLLPVLDDLQDGLGHIPPELADSGLANGLRLVEQKFLSALAKLGVQPIEALGRPFDPARHEAVDFDPAGGGTVTAVYRRGYTLGDSLLRPAMVKVGPAGEGGGERT